MSDDNDGDVNIADDEFPDTEGSSREEEKYEEALEPAIIYLHPIIYSTCKRCLAMLLRVDLTSSCGISLTCSVRFYHFTIPSLWNSVEQMLEPLGRVLYRVELATNETRIFGSVRSSLQPLDTYSPSTFIDVSPSHWNPTVIAKSLLTFRQIRQ
jgi:hypothetical protein